MSDGVRNISTWSNTTMRRLSRPACYRLTLVVALALAALAGARAAEEDATGEKERAAQILGESGIHIQYLKVLKQFRFIR